MDTAVYLVDRLKAGQFTRVVAFGSSNTERRVPGMHWFDCFELACRNTFGPHTACINSGRGGDTTVDLLARFERDCLAYRPEVVFITIGGNDSNPEKKLSVEAFRKNLMEVVGRVQALGGRAVLQTYYGCDLANMDPRHAAAFPQMMETVRAVGQEKGCLVIDHLARWEHLQHSAYSVYRGLMLDPMHINYTGNLAMGLDLARRFGLKLPEDLYFREARALQALMDALENGDREDAESRRGREG